MKHLRIALTLLLLHGAAALASDDLPTLRLLNYRGPGNADAALAPALCDGDTTSAWVATGLTKTKLGPPFEFEFEFLDGAEHDLSGIRLLSTTPVEGWQAREFEVRLPAPGKEGFDKVIYHGTQKTGGDSQTHLFESPVTARRFMFKLLSNHGDPDNIQVNELSPVFNADETAAARSPEAASTALPLAKPAPPARKYAGRFPYNQLQATPAPAVHHEEEVVNDIDRFLLAKLEARGLDFAPLAAKDVLLRRVTYDLTGLPPTLREREAFLADSIPHAYETVVDRLLASPRYGEQWAQHWLDLVRYADTDGYALNGLRQGAWRYRDYVIAAFNKNKPYNIFVAEQLAADEMDSAPLDSLPALSFCRLGPFRANSGNQNLDRNRQEFMVEVTGAVSTTFLGLTVGCARCHDHKIDPIPQDDYYRLQAFFEAMEPATLLMASSTDQKQWRDSSATAQKTLAGLESKRQALIKPARERLLNKQPGSLPTDKEIVAELRPEEAREVNAVIRQQKAAQALLPAPLPAVWGIRDSGRVAPTTYTLTRGEITMKAARVLPRVPGILPEAEASEGAAPVTVRSTGRRLALAQWLTGPGQAQTARVMVNRLWQHHFGRGIVATPSNFGGLGRAPTHPELLDWLANDFIAGGWSLKRMHRQMVLSRAYQQAGEASPQAVAKDETNELFSRFIRHRLTAEEIRDSALLHAGTLSGLMGGEGVVVPQPPEALVELKKGAWRVSKDTASYTMRSIYLFVERKFRLPLMESFDQPDTMTACPERSRSTHVLQTLGLLNNEWMLDQAGAVAARVRSLAEDNDSRLNLAYRMICGRDPSPRERDIARQYVASPDHEDALADYCHVLFNLNRFLYVD